MPKDAHKAGTDQAQSFKKPFQTVDRPPTVDHNMHDDLVRNPPKNVAEGEIMPRPDPKQAAQDKNAGRVPGQEVLDRIKHSDVESELVEESSVHS